MSATKLRVLKAAAEAAGGTGPLAAHLGVSEPMLRRYLSGDFPPPDSLFLRAVDFILPEADGPPSLMAPPSHSPFGSPSEA